jgi:hypothetical protein
MILSRLVHQENIETLISETGMQFGEVRDDLTNLLSGRMIDVYEDTEKGRVPTTFYDLDNLRDYYFRATKRGQSVLNTPTEPEWNSK